MLLSGAVGDAIFRRAFRERAWWLREQAPEDPAGEYRVAATIVRFVGGSILIVLGIGNALLALTG
jgi:hypothetical protein